MKERNKKISNLTKEEKELLESYESGEWKSIPNIEEEIGFYKKVAQNSL